MAIIYGHNLVEDVNTMDVTIVDMKNHLTELIRAVESGERVVITRHGKPVAELTQPLADRRQIRLGGMKHRIRLLPGWDAPIDLDRFLAGDL